jgi:hypothetical protein
MISTIAPALSRARRAFRRFRLASAGRMTVHST